MEKGGQKVWSKLLQIGLDDRLEGIKENLPSTYTTLHLVHCLSDEELKVGVEEGHVHPKVSQGSLNRWIKYFRFEGRQNRSLKTSLRWSRSLDLHRFQKTS